MTKHQREQQLLRTLGDPEALVVHRLARPGLWLSVICVLAFVGWASWAEIDEVTRGEGRVVPVTRLQKIQSLEGGILETLLVSEGELVAAGQPLARLNHTRFYAAFMEGASQALALRAAIARLEAEVEGTDRVVFPEDIDANSPEAISERKLFQARREKYQETIAALEEEVVISKEQLALLAPLIAKKAVGEIEGLRLRQEIAALKGRKTEIRKSFLQEAYTELTAKKSELNALDKTLLQRKDQLNRTELVSPVKGRVNNIRITSKGGVVQPGEAIMEIIPIEDQLFIDAKVKPKDVAFLAPGMPARVKITAYDYTIYGDMAGTLEQISADTIEEDGPRGKENYYQIVVRTETNFLERNGEVLPIRPGMVANVDVLNGKRTVLSYLLKPLVKAKLY